MTVRKIKRDARKRSDLVWGKHSGGGMVLHFCGSVLGWVKPCSAYQRAERGHDFYVLLANSWKAKGYGTQAECLQMLETYAIAAMRRVVRKADAQAARKRKAGKR